MDYVPRVDLLLKTLSQMLQPRLNNCKECGDIVSLIKDIDCKLFTQGKRLHQNITLELNKKIDGSVLFDLLQYKRILQYKAVNADYLLKFSVKDISNKVNILKYR